MALGWGMSCYNLWWNIFWAGVVCVFTLWMRLLVSLGIRIRNRHWMWYWALHRTRYWDIKRHVVELFFFLGCCMKMFDLRLQWFIQIITLDHLSAARSGSIYEFTLGSNWFFHHSLFIILKTWSYLSLNICVVPWYILLHRFNDRCFIIIHL